jgi:hypothetical protein
MAADQTPAMPPAAPPAAAPSKSKKIYGWAITAGAVVIMIAGGVQVYEAVRENFVLPECDSKRAKDTLSNVFKEHKFEPLRYESVKTVSANDQEIVCNAVLPLPDGVNLVADYTFFWEGNTARIKYSLVRRAP